MASSETLLEQIVRQAQHVVLRLRTIYVLDTLAREFKDPLITSHWSTLSSPTCSSVRVSILSAGYDTIIKTQLVIHVGEKMQRVICKDGRVLNFSYEPQELRDFILCQLAQHQISGVQNLARVMGWQVLSASSFLGNGAVEPLGSAAGCLISNAKADRFLAVRHSPQFNYTVYMAQAPSGTTLDSVIEDTKWENLPSSFKEVKVDKMDGKNLLSKLELLMAALST
jgi:mediator of RNA polymerase II transcription subunit 17